MYHPSNIIKFDSEDIRFYSWYTVVFSCAFVMQGYNAWIAFLITLGCIFLGNVTPVMIRSMLKTNG